jgi:hypothetical protein
MLEHKMSQDQTGSAMDMLEDLLRAIEAKTTNPGALTLYSLGTWLDSVRNQYDIICDTNSKLLWSANNQIQQELYNFFPVICRRADVSDPEPALRNGADRLKAYFLRQDSADRCDRRCLDDLHHDVLAALQQHLPLKQSHKRQLDESLHDYSGSSAQPEKRARTNTTQLITAVAQAGTQAFASNYQQLTSRFNQQHRNFSRPTRGRGGSAPRGPQ